MHQVTVSRHWGQDAIELPDVLEALFWTLPMMNTDSYARGVTVLYNALHIAEIRCHFPGHQGAGTEGILLKILASQLLTNLRFFVACKPAPSDPFVIPICAPTWIVLQVLAPRFECGLLDL
jgi:hypothetical protein